MLRVSGCIDARVGQSRPSTPQRRVGSRCYAPPPLNSTSAASLASSSRTIGMRPIISATASNSEHDASGKSNAQSWEELAGSASQRSAQPGERCRRRGNDLLGKQLHITLEL